MENLIDILKKIKKEEFANIINFAEMDIQNKKFKEYEYFTIEKNGLFFYIEKTSMGCFLDGIIERFTVTTYKKINYNTRQQLSYPQGFNDYEELKEIIEKMSNEPIKTALPKTCKQTINHELNTYYNTEYGYITLMNYLYKIAGYREKEILKNIDKITMNLNNANYLVFEFYNKDGQSFAINTKNINRLIIS